MTRELLLQPLPPDQWAIEEDTLEECSCYACDCARAVGGRGVPLRPEPLAVVTSHEAAMAAMRLLSL